MYFVFFSILTGIYFITHNNDAPVVGKDSCAAITVLISHLCCLQGPQCRRMEVMSSIKGLKTAQLN